MNVTLLDGGMGQELVHRSSQPPHVDWGDWVMRNEPEIVQALHEDYLRAGAQVITLNTYLTTPRTCLDADGNRDRDDFVHSQTRAMELADAARSAVRPDALIAGSLPPLAWSYLPDLVEAFEKNVADYAEIVALNAPHVDLIICETMSTADEARAAATAAAASGKPVWVSWTLKESAEADGTMRLRSGETVSDAIAALDGIPVAAMMFNCCPPESIARAIASVPVRTGGYANAYTSVSGYEPGLVADVIGTRTDLGPDAYAERVLAWVADGATIVGGCCATTPDHIAALDARLRAEGHTPVALA